jgi:DNA repair protein RecO (recombination protein O)
MNSTSRIECQPAYLLHSRPYRNTSVIIDVFSRDYGRVGLVARGARSARSRWAAVLLPFQRVLLSWQGRGELKTVIAAECDDAPCWLQGNALVSALYGNELLLRLLHRDDPHPELLSRYEQLLSALRQVQAQGRDALESLEPILRCFEKYLLQELGYGLSLEYDARNGEPVQAGSSYTYYLDEGPVLCRQPGATAFIISGSTLLALARDELSDANCRREAKQLMRLALRQHLGERPLYSRRLYRSPSATTLSGGTGE